MAQFDAGSIVGTLDLDRDPYSLGLDLARQQAEDFESNKITATIDLADTEAKARLDELIAKEHEAAKQVDVKVDVQGAEESAAELETVKKAADSASGFGGGGGGMGGLLAAALALSPALIPIGAVGAAGLAAFAGGIAQAGAALAPFALVAKGDFTDMQTAVGKLAAAQKALESATTTQQKAKAIKELADAEKQLSGPMGQAAHAYGLVMAAVDKLKKDTAGPVFGVMTQAFQLAAQILPKLEPVITASAAGIGSMLGIFKTAFAGPTFSNFLNLITKNIAPDLTLLAHTLVNFGTGFANMIIGLDPITQRIYKWIDGLSKSFSNWSTTGFGGFLAYVNKEAGPVGGLISSIWDALKNIVKVATPLGDLLLGPLSLFFKTIANVKLGPLATALGDLVTALDPLFPALGTIINDLLPAIVPLLDAAVPLVANLAGAFADLVQALPPGFVQIIGGIALGMWALTAALDADPLMLAAVAFGLLVAALPRGWAEVLIGIAAAIWAINIALDADPVVFFAMLIAAAVIGIVVGVKEIIKHWGAISSFFEHVWNGIWQAFKWGIDGVKTAYEFIIKIPGYIADHWKAMVSFFTNIMSTVVNTVAHYAKLILSALLLIVLWPLALYENWGAITKFFSKLWADVLKGTKDGWNDIVSFFTDLWPKILHGFTVGWNNVVDFVGKVPGRIKAFFVNAAGWLYNTGINILHGLHDGAVDGFKAVWSWLIGLPALIKNAAVGMWDGLGDAFKAVINTIIGWWDSFVDHLHIRIARFTLIPGTPFTDPVKVGPISADLGSKEMHINKLADGAFIASRVGGILANIGEGQSDEAVVPLDRWDVTRKGQGGFTDAQIATLVAALRSLPEATGQAVGATVGDKFKAATEAQTRKLQTASRAA